MLTALATLFVNGWPRLDVAEADTTGVAFGASASDRNGQTVQAAYQELERKLGTKLPIVRTFSRFDKPIDHPVHTWAASGNRTVFAGISTRLDNGERLTWRQIADAREGSLIHDLMVQLADSSKRLDTEVWIVLSHEPESSVKRDLGNNEDFKDAWRKLHDVFQQRGATDVRWVWTMTSWAYEVERFNPTDPRRADLWYPGDLYVDYLAATPYNINGCRAGLDSRWRSLEDVALPFLEWSRKHPNKQLVLAEFGSDEGAAGQKAGWIDDVRQLMKEPEWGQRFAAIIYFHNDDTQSDPNSTCDWWLDSSPSTLQAAQRLANDPYYGARATRDLPVAPVNVLCHGKTATMVGTEGDDELIGTPFADVIVGLGGNDRIEGLGGNDVICGGPGNDRILGGPGNDVLFGEDGRDVLQGQTGRDLAIGGTDRDRLSGGRGKDRLRGGSGNDVILGNAGIDVLQGGHGRDRLSGGTGRDTIDGGSAVDRCLKPEAIDTAISCELPW